ncbi:MAG TPA: class II aldolase/adducin family protein [Ignavibacteriales bacterium]|nr:class II aldolase/adducin family protein [Ignavibacteriales bacterium]
MEQNITLLRKEIVDAGKRVYDRGFVASNDGNISARIDAKRALITPTGVSKGFMRPEDLIIVDMDGNLVSGDRKPSSETNMHLQIYKDRPDVNSVCHAHPPYSTGFAVAGFNMDKMLLPEVIISLGVIPLVEYGTTGTEELYAQIKRYIQDYDALLLANHGALTVGTSVLNAYHKMETLEHAAKIQFIAQQLGKVNELNGKQSDQLIELRGKFGIRKDLGLKGRKK